MPKLNGLSDKQALFCREYVIDLNATQAAIRAGYSAKTAKEIGAQNLSKLTIQAEIQRLTADRSQRTEITADYVLQKIQSIIEATSAEGESEYNPQAALKGCELLGKHLSMWTDKVQHSGEMVIESTIDVTGLSSEALEELANLRKK